MEPSVSNQSASVKKRMRRMKLSVKIQIYLSGKYKINPYPSRYDLINMASEVDVEVIRVQNWFKNHRRKDWLSGLLCRRCRFFRSPLDEQQHVRATFSRPCLRYFSNVSKEVTQRAPTPLTPSTISDSNSSVNSGYTGDQPAAIPPLITPGPVVSQPGTIMFAVPPACHYQQQMTFQEMPCEVNLNQGYYYSHHYGHVYATHYGGHEGVNYYSEDGCPVSQSWAWNAGSVMSCSPERAPERQWGQPVGLFQQTAEQTTPETNWI